MFTLDAGMQTHVAGELTTLAWIAKITRTDGTIFAFTTHDVDLVVSAVTYRHHRASWAARCASRLISAWTMFKSSE